MTDHEYPVIHLFSPGVHHEEQGIIGNKEGLEKLLKVIQRALENDKTDATFFVSDGEGYDLYVKMASDDKIGKIAVPYMEGYCKEDRRDAIYPWPWGD